MSGTSAPEQWKRCESAEYAELRDVAVAASSAPFVVTSVDGVFSSLNTVMSEKRRKRMGPVRTGVVASLFTNKDPHNLFPGHPKKDAAQRR